MATDDLITIRLRLTGGTAAAAEAKAVSAEVSTMGRATAAAGKSASLASRGMTRFRTGLISLAATARRAAVIGIAALGFETWRSIGAFRESREVSMQTQAVIKSTGGAAKVTAKDVANLSGALSLKTGVDDEVIQSGANMLLTFRNIRNEVGKGNDIFNQSVAAANDMAAALGKDPKTAALQLGKALNDPILGVTALGRSGIQFSEDQKAMITSLVESGDLLSAQKMILGEVNKEFGGSARAHSDALDRLSVAWENLEEKAGKALFPFITKAAHALTDFINQAIKGKGAGGKFVEVVKDIGGAIGDGVSKLVEWGKAIGPSVIGTAKDIAQWIGGAVSTVKDFVNELLHGSGGVGKFGQDLKAIVLGVKDLGVWLFKVSKGALLQLWSGIKNVFGGIVKVIGGVVKLIGGILRGDWSRAWEGAKDIFSGAIQLIKGAIQTLTAPFRAAFSAIKHIVGSVIDWIADKVQWVVDKITDAKNALDDLLPGSSAENISDVATQVADAQSTDPTAGAPHPSAGGGPHAPHGQQDKLAPLAPSSRGQRGRRMVIHLHNHTYLDGKKVSENTTKHVLAAAARA